MKKFLVFFRDLGLLIVASAVFSSVGVSSPSTQDRREPVVLFQDGSCYKIDNGWVTIQVEVGRRDGVRLRRIFWASAFIVPTTESWPYMEGDRLFCPELKYPDRP